MKNKIICIVGVFVIALFMLVGCGETGVIDETTTTNNEEHTSKEETKTDEVDLTIATEAPTQKVESIDELFLEFRDKSLGIMKDFEQSNINTGIFIEDIQKCYPNMKNWFCRK